ncbi:unnamed protein product [Candidula unifasciata]|uniref:Enhancer of mRNA-decapping protein 3 n=1 Tax=Candidula unifasciata TaxID=100452 RepID=A0A8S3Z433_9EUPU|nr:unnamed protein product [Candidula unifasciata]
MTEKKSSLRCIKMPSEFIGSMVSIDCGELGTYQGRVEKIDPVMNTLTISHAFHNGLRSDLSVVNLSSTTILDIKIIHASQEAKEIITRKATPSKMTKEIDEVTKPTCTSPVKIIKATSKAKTGFSSTNASGSIVNQLELAQGRGSCRRRLSPPDSPSKLLDPKAGSVVHRSLAYKGVNNEAEHVEQWNGYGDESSVKPRNGFSYPTDQSTQKITAAKKMERGGRRGANAKNNECFSAPAESFLQEFDFESNLAMFNKKAVFREIETDFPELNLEPGFREKKYRHDENILQPGENNSAPVVMKQQIKVPGTKFQLYYTDTGLVVPSVSRELREKVCEVASQHGLSHVRQLESYGRAASEMVIHLIGGSHRIHPKNGHQMPAVVILCGPHEHGALGACCARILSSHGVQVTLLVPNSAAIPTSLSQEIELYKLIGNSLVHTVGGLPDTIDLIVTAMDSHSSLVNTQHPWYQSIVTWMKNSDIRAQVLSLDPPSQGPSIPAKWSLYKVLPLNQVSSACGSLYLCDLSIPSAIFQECGITYVSPFGSKFVIPLHAKE